MIKFVGAILFFFAISCAMVWLATWATSEPPKCARMNITALGVECLKRG